ncbi:pentatricopeptide repeat-containing protein At4g21300 [Arabidopsis lyrata subsp. lyrata]|uniref:pentatricopeptide repeat-containing protein At4g21300 n=1 Tax=Arabidopsis lyrata subsp. lyrata TaxID=81972 RepID=UPI000A29CD79|nr:pentatricopeptide repeat-containing protein At4g21300 [Arabidopsis lyrata subsp. lyrata]|eukprot:XP_020881918.1 pentatricopeptide repeat-containing protein At4g21300 [Arabidopsis lyrata subsp. lyrata]
MMYNLELLCFAYVGDRRSVVSILLSHEHAGDIFFHPKSRELHGLAMKMHMLEDEMSICKIMTLYSIEGCSLQSIENIFRTSKTKGRLIYNHMISVYGKHYAEDADRLFLEMVKTIRPNGYTFRYLLEAWTIACDPERTLKVFQSMKIYGVEPDSVHYGAIVDCYARMRTPYYIHMAILFLKEHPIAQGQYAFNTILNRCVPQQIASSKEEMEEIEETIKLAQDMVDHFDEKGFMYAVLEKTYWRLENHGLKWPWTVSKTRGE